MIALGFGYEEIAKKENIPVGTVRSRLFRARQALLSGEPPVEPKERRKHRTVKLKEVKVSKRRRRGSLFLIKAFLKAAKKKRKWSRRVRTSPHLHVVKSVKPEIQIIKQGRGKRKITEDQAKYILQSDERPCDLARRFNLTPTDIHNVLSGRSFGRFQHLRKKKI